MAAAAGCGASQCHRHAYIIPRLVFELHRHAGPVLLQQIAPQISRKCVIHSARVDSVIKARGAEVNGLETLRRRDESAREKVISVVERYVIMSRVREATSRAVGHYRHLRR